VPLTPGFKPKTEEDGEMDQNVAEHPQKQTKKQKTKKTKTTNQTNQKKEKITSETGREVGRGGV